MELHFLGTGSANPSPTRGASSVILRNPSGSCWMFDCGEGTQVQLMKSNIRPGKLDKIFITHLHGDHLFGLPGLLCTISMNCSEDRAPVQIYGPKGLKQYLETSLTLSDSQLRFPYTVHELCEAGLTMKCYKVAEGRESKLAHSSNFADMVNVQDSCIYPNNRNTWDVFHDGNLRVSAAILKHRIICFGYVIEESCFPGRLNAELLKSKGVPPGPLYAKIKNGESIITKDGIVVKAEEVVSPPCPGRKVVILGDTCDSTQIANTAMNADVLVHEATNENDHQEKCIEYGHSTPGMAGIFARSICARKLVLTHFSQRYKGINDKLKADEESVCKLVEQAKEEFGENVLAAEDMLVLNIERPP